MTEQVQSVTQYTWTAMHAWDNINYVRNSSSNEISTKTTHAEHLQWNQYLIHIVYGHAHTIVQISYSSTLLNIVCLTWPQGLIIGYPYVKQV